MGLFPPLLLVIIIIIGIYVEKYINKRRAETYFDKYRLERYKNIKKKTHVWSDERYEYWYKRELETGREVTTFEDLDNWVYGKNNVDKTKSLQTDIQTTEASKDSENNNQEITISIQENQNTYFSGQTNIEFTDGSEYIGELKDGRFHSQGTYTFPDNRKILDLDGSVMHEIPGASKYVGEWKDGTFHGPGTYTWEKGDFAGTEYQGEWNGGRYHGQGTFTWPDGRKYVGEWKDGIANGKGTFTCRNGEKYEGGWKDGIANGKGTFYLKPGDNKFIGNFKNGTANGQGTYYWANGSKWIGDWINGVMHNTGTYILVDGSSRNANGWDIDIKIDRNIEMDYFGVGNGLEVENQPKSISLQKVSH